MQPKQESPTWNGHVHSIALEMFILAQGNLPNAKNWYVEWMLHLRCMFFSLRKMAETSTDLYICPNGHATHIFFQLGHWVEQRASCIKRAKDVLLPAINGRNARSYRSCAGCTFLTACRPENCQEVAKRKRLLFMDVDILLITNYPCFFPWTFWGRPDRPLLPWELSSTPLHLKNLPEFWQT